MSEFPKKIWIDDTLLRKLGTELCAESDIPYIRADLVEKAIKAMETAEAAFVRYTIHHMAKEDEEKSKANANLAELMRDAIELLED